MIGRRGFLKAVFGASVGAVTRQIGNVVEALTTRKVSNVVLSAVTADQILDAKMFFCPFIPLMTVAQVEETLHGEGRLPVSLGDSDEAL
jgi:hypothetical protein